MHVGKSKLVAAAWAALVLFGAQAAHAGPVVNGDFETGDFTGWTTSLDPVYDGVDVLLPQAGTYAAYFGNPDSISSISQTLATLAGTTYNISFWLMNEADVPGASTPNSFEFDWGGIAQLSLVNQSAFGYTNYQFSLLANSASTDLAFKFNHATAFWDFDSVTVEAAANAVPEPDSLALTALAGALALVVSARRRAVGGRKSSAAA
jgi:hypothetical protein